MQTGALPALLLVALVSYLLGSINIAIMLSRHLYKTDVRTLGSGNAGMTNIARNFGKGPAVLTLVWDAGKGVLAVCLGRLLVGWLYPGLDPTYGAYLAAVVVTVGHMFPVFFGFKGGKGVATTGGALLTLQPLIGVCLIGIFVIVLLISKMVSLGAIIGVAGSAPITLLYGLFISHRAPVFSAVCVAIITGLVIWAHRENIQRIRAGTERKIGEKKE